MGQHRDFFNEISVSCKKLEKLFYLGGMAFDESVTFSRKIKMDEIEFAKLCCLSVKFLSIHRLNRKALTQELFDYFSKKCPKLNGELKLIVGVFLGKDFFTIFGGCE